MVGKEIKKLMIEDLVIESQTIDDILVVKLEGELDAFTAQQVKEQLSTFIKKGYKKIVVNLSQVRYINSTSIGVLVSRLRDLKNRQGELVLAELSDRVNRILTLVGGKRLFQIFNTEQEAIASLAKSQEVGDVGALVSIISPN